MTSAMALLIAVNCREGSLPWMFISTQKLDTIEIHIREREMTTKNARRPLPRGLRWHSRQTTNEHRQNSLQRFVVLFDVVGIKIDSTPASNRLPQCVRIQHAFAAESGHSSFQLSLSK